MAFQFEMGFSKPWEVLGSQIQLMRKCSFVSEGWRRSTDEADFAKTGIHTQFEFGMV